MQHREARGLIDWFERETALNDGLVDTNVCKISGKRAGRKSYHCEQLQTFSHSRSFGTR
jgi:hypothetical protein